MSNLRGRVRALLEAQKTRPSPHANLTTAQIDARIEQIFEGIRARRAAGCTERQPDSPERRAEVARIVAHFAAVAKREAKHAQLTAYAAEQDRIAKLNGDAVAKDAEERLASEAEARKLEQLWQASPERLQL